MKRPHILGCLASVLATVSAFAGGSRMFLGETRMVPDGWTAPVYSVGADGKVTFIPSVPAGYKPMRSGVGLGVSGVTVFRDPKQPSQAGYLIHINDDKTIRVKARQAFDYHGRKLKILDVKDEKLRVQEVMTGRIIKLNKRRWQTVTDE